MPRSPTPSNTPSVWVDALCAWPTLTRCPTQASGISFSDIVSDIAASLRGRQLRLQHSEAFAPQHLVAFDAASRLRRGDVDTTPRLIVDQAPAICPPPEVSSASKTSPGSTACLAPLRVSNSCRPLRVITYLPA